MSSLMPAPQSMPRMSPVDSAERRIEDLFTYVDRLWEGIVLAKGVLDPTIRQVRTNTDSKHAQSHAIGSTSDHTASTLALLNALISDATLREWEDDQGATDIHDGNIAESSVTQHVAAIDHDATLNFEANEHIDWSATGAADVHLDRVPTGRKYSTEAGITAYAGGGQASAYQLNSDFSRADTVGSTNDSVKLLAAVDGLRQTVRNDGANDLAVYPASGDAINALATDAAYALIPGGTITFQSISASQWFTF